MAWLTGVGAKAGRKKLNCVGVYITWRLPAKRRLFNLF